MAGEKKTRKHGAEYMAAWKALGAAKCWLDSGRFGAPCPLCGKKKHAVWFSERPGGSVECFCKGCGAEKKEIYQAIGLDMRALEIQTIVEREEEKMAAIDVIGGNRCTACEHYANETVHGGQQMYGCRKRNLYRMNAIWEGETRCPMYQPDRESLKKGAASLETGIAAYRRVLEEYEARLALVQELLEEK